MKYSIKKYSKIIITCFIILYVIGMATNLFGLEAAINPSYGPTDKSQAETAIKDTMSALSIAVAGPLFAGLASLVTIIGALVFILLWTVFTSLGITAGAGLFTYPFTDLMVFNSLPFFDPNFINPAESSTVSLMKETIQQLYYSMFVIAGLVFVIAAMVIGIKLALSTIAAEKAVYKQALLNWVMGIVLLFTAHFLMAGIFKLNEIVVEAASKAVSGSNTVTFTVDALELIPFIGQTGGKTLSGFFDAINNFSKELTGKEAIPQIKATFRGYGQIMLLFLWKGIGGDMVSALIFCILIGQSVVLIVQYTKRLFYSILLGMFVPLIIATDVVKKSVG